MHTQVQKEDRILQCSIMFFVNIYKTAKANFVNNFYFYFQIDELDKNSKNYWS